MGESNKRILMLFDEFNVGGTETHVLSLTKELLNQGCKVVIAAKPGPLQNEFLSLGCPIYTKLFSVKRKRAERLARIVKRHQINVIHAHMSTTGLIGSFVAKKLKVPFVFTVHGTYYRQKTLKLILRRSAAVVTVSEPLKRWVEQLGLSSVLILNGIDYKQFEPTDPGLARNELQLSDQGPILLYAARLTGRKAVICKLLIEICSELRDQYFSDLNLLIAGDGKQHKRLRDFAQEVHKGRPTFIHFLGNRTDMPHIYSASDCVVGTGRVALEAMGCERTVIAVGEAGLCGIVTPDRFDQCVLDYFGDHHGLNGYTKEDLASLVKTVLLSPADREYWGREGRQLVMNRFDNEHISQRWLDIYHSVTS